MYMKLNLLFLALLLPLAASAQLPWLKGKTPVPFQKDTTRAAKPLPPPPDTLTATSVLFVNDSTLEAPSVYLRRAANAQGAEMVFAVCSVALVGLGAADERSSTICFVGAGVTGIIAIIQHITAISDLKKASKSLSRFHLQSNGITIDL